MPTTRPRKATSTRTVCRRKVFKIMIPANLTHEQLIKDMKACEQTKGMSVLDHGTMVRDYYHDLYFHLYEDSELRFEWKLPKWVMENKSYILNELCHDYTMQEYM